jgi:hypothetical protein
MVKLLDDPVNVFDVVDPRGRYRTLIEMKSADLQEAVFQSSMFADLVKIRATQQQIEFRATSLTSSHFRFIYKEVSENDEVIECVEWWKCSIVNRRGGGGEIR